jgi:serine/threonine-protein kinase
MLALQAEIARAVANGVRAVVTPSESARLQQTRPTSQAAEEAFLVGRYHLGRYGLESAEQALQAFTEAIRLDPTHARAHAGAARARVALGFAGVTSQTEARALALADVRNALALDSDQADAHAAAADLRFYYDWDWKGADAEYRRAIELNSSSTYARAQYARYLAAARQMNEAVEHAALAAQLDPLSAEAVQTHGLILYYARDYDAAVERLTAALAIDPGFARAHYVLGRVREAQGRIDEAIDETHRAIDLAKDGTPWWRLQLIRLSAVAGRADEARSRYEQFLKELGSRNVPIDKEQLAYFHLALGDHDRALGLIEEALKEREPRLLWLAVDPRVDAIRSTGRFRAIERGLGLN